MDTLPVTLRPRNLMIWVFGFTAVLVVASIYFWFSLDPKIRAMFTIAQLGTLILIVGIFIAIICSMALSMVRVEISGLTVRNTFLTKKYAWEQIRGVRYAEGDPWAYLLVAEDDDVERRALMGVQTTDGQRAKDAVRQLRDLVAEYRPQA